MTTAALLTVEFTLAWSSLKDVLPVNPSSTQTEVDVGHNSLITEPGQKKWILHWMICEKHYI